MKFKELNKKSPKSRNYEGMYLWLFQFYQSMENQLPLLQGNLPFVARREIILAFPFGSFRIVAAGLGVLAPFTLLARGERKGRWLASFGLE